MIDLMQRASRVAPTLCHLGRLVEDEQILVERNVLTRVAGQDMIIVPLVCVTLSRMVTVMHLCCGPARQRVGEDGGGRGRRINPTFPPSPLWIL